MIFVSFNHNQNMAEEKSSKTKFYRLVAPIEQLLTRFEKKSPFRKREMKRKNEGKANHN